MNILLSVLGFIVILHCAYAPPVSPEKEKDENDVEDDLAEYTEYHRYLKEVVQALESDSEFRERLDKANEEDVRSGKIAEQLDFVNHNVRTRLDEIKRRELERLRHLATKKFELTNNLEVDPKVSNEHVDHANPHTFEIEDLKKLIHKTTLDLEAADKKRREQFKEYEMQKAFENQQKYEFIDDPNEKKEYKEKEKKEQEAKVDHQPLHHPGSKQQLEEVWHKQDQMDQQFDPKTFFMMHDVDGNGAWDPNEVKALFIKELDKMYGPNGPNKDLNERAEEMERMREHVFKENDRNQDGLIDFNEFMMETQREDFNQDEGWKSIDENEIYSQAEYGAYMNKRNEEIKYLRELGLVDHRGKPIPGSEHKIKPALQQLYAPRHHAYPDQYQQPGQAHYPPGQQYPNQHMPPGQQYPNQQFPPGQQYPNQQIPPSQQYPNQQLPSGQPHPPPPNPVINQQYQQGQNHGQLDNQYPSQPQQFQGQPQQFQGQPQQFQGQPQQFQGQPQQFQGQPQQFQGQQPPQPQVNQPNLQAEQNKQPMQQQAQFGQVAQDHPGQAPPQNAQVDYNSIKTGQVPMQGQAQVGQVPVQNSQVPNQVYGQQAQNSNLGQVPSQVQGQQAQNPVEQVPSQPGARSSSR